jgi:hypothetical protein
MKAYGGSECIDPHFVDLGTSWRWVVNCPPRPLYPKERGPLNRMLGGQQSRSGRRGEEKILDPTRTRTSTPRSSSYNDCAIPAPIPIYHCLQNGCTKKLVSRYIKDDLTYDKSSRRRKLNTYRCVIFGFQNFGNVVAYLDLNGLLWELAIRTENKTYVSLRYITLLEGWNFLKE